jgi:LuxR family maltose regulon positive regulatory protein
LRASDLRFTPEEAAAYLTDAMGLALTAGDVAVLEGRTEGWIAGLQLAALSMQGRDDPADFIADFAGDDRYIVDYLVEEVLGRQSDQVCSFLLQTSVLHRLTGPLCDAVVGTAGGKAMLEALDCANLFLVPLDDRRRWYRYHHLFAGVLQVHLLAEQPEAIAGLHRRAADWYEANGQRSEAAQQALAGGDPARGGPDRADAASAAAGPAGGHHRAHALGAFQNPTKLVQPARPRKARLHRELPGRSPTAAIQRKALRRR